MSEYDCVKRWEYDHDMRKIEEKLDMLCMQFETHVPYFLVGITSNHERKYIAAFSTEEKLRAFVQKCTRKTRPYGFRKYSPLGEFANWDIARFHITSLPVDPRPNELT